MKHNRQVYSGTLLLSNVYFQEGIKDSRDFISGHSKTVDKELIFNFSAYPRLQGDLVQGESPIRTFEECTKDGKKGQYCSMKIIVEYGKKGDRGYEFQIVTGYYDLGKKMLSIGDGNIRASIDKGFCGRVYSREQNAKRKERSKNRNKSRSYSGNNSSSSKPLSKSDYSKYMQMKKKLDNANGGKPLSKAEFKQFKQWESLLN